MNVMQREAIADVLPEYRDFVEKILPLAADNYYEFVFSFSREFYSQRVEMVGINDAGRILDAGSGYGQWSVELAKRCDQIECIDINPNMTEIGRRFAEWCGVSNATFSTQSISGLHFPDEYFDFVWCWGVLMFGPIERSLAELRRVLKPGGLLLVGCLNARGRWLRKLYNALTANPINWALARICVVALGTGHRINAVPNYTTTKMAKARCAAAGLELVSVGLDGCLDLTREGRKLPAFAPRFLSFEENIEFLARKPS